MTKDQYLDKLVSSMSIQQAIECLQQYSSWTDNQYIGRWEEMKGLQDENTKHLLWQLNFVNTIDMLKFCASIQVIANKVNESK